MSVLHKGTAYARQPLSVMFISESTVQQQGSMCGLYKCSRVSACLSGGLLDGGCCACWMVVVLPAGWWLYWLRRTWRTVRLDLMRWEGELRSKEAELTSSAREMTERAGPAWRREKGTVESVRREDGQHRGQGRRGGGDRHVRCLCVCVYVYVRACVRGCMWVWNSAAASCWCNRSMREGPGLPGHAIR